MRRLAIFLVLFVLGFAATAGARPPALLWLAPDAAPARSHAALVVERDAEGVRLLSGRIVAGPAKLKARAPEGGLLFVLRDGTGAPLLLGETFDAELFVHGDEPDPATGRLRSISAPLERTAFAIRVPLPAGAADVAFYARANDGPGPPPVELLRSLGSKDASLVPLGAVALPSP